MSNSIVDIYQCLEKCNQKFCPHKKKHEKISCNLFIEQNNFIPGTKKLQCKCEKVKCQNILKVLINGKFCDVNCPYLVTNYDRTKSCCKDSDDIFLGTPYGPIPLVYTDYGYCVVSYRSNRCLRSYKKHKGL